MRATTILMIAALTLGTTYAGAQQNEQAQLQENGIAYSPVDCVRAGKPAVLHLNVGPKGKLVTYFRKVNSTDLCSLEGNNRGAVSTAMLPEFAPGDQVEFFFVVTDGKRVVAKSADVYRVTVNENCETPFARHVDILTMVCGPNGKNSLPTSVRAGYAVKNTTVSDGSPFQP